MEWAFLQRIDAHTITSLRQLGRRKRFVARNPWPVAPFFSHTHTFLPSLAETICNFRYFLYIFRIRWRILKYLF